jgi:hypothetical protein
MDEESRLRLALTKAEVVAHGEIKDEARPLSAADAVTSVLSAGPSGVVDSTSEKKKKSTTNWDDDRSQGAVAAPAAIFESKSGSSAAVPPPRRAPTQQPETLCTPAWSKNTIKRVGVGMAVVGGAIAACVAFERWLMRGSRRV